MRNGMMDVSEFEGVLSRNLYQPWGVAYNVEAQSRLGLHPNVATLMIQFPPDEIMTEYYETHNIGGAVNIHNLYNFDKTGLTERTFNHGKRYRPQGWRGLLSTMLANREIRPSREIQKLLGDQDFDIATKDLRCW